MKQDRLAVEWLGSQPHWLSKISPCAGEIAVFPPPLIKRPAGFKIAAPQCHETLIAIGIVVGRIGGDGAVECFERFRKSLHLLERDAAIVMGCRDTGLQRDRLVI